jgi:hypothetical protein
MASFEFIFPKPQVAKNIGVLLAGMGCKLLNRIND